METNRKRKVVITLFALVLLLVGAVGVVRRLRADRQVAKVRQLRDGLTGEAGRKLTPEQRREGWQQFRREFERLSPAQKKALSADRRQASRERLAKFFRLSPAEKVAQLDRDIARMESMRQRPPAGGGPSRRPPGAAGKRPTTPEQRERWRKDRLDDSTPEERAQRAEYLRLLNQRRQQRGLPGGPRR